MKETKHKGLRLWSRVISSFRDETATRSEFETDAVLYSVVMLAAMKHLEASGALESMLLSIAAVSGGGKDLNPDLNPDPKEAPEQNRAGRRFSSLSELETPELVALDRKLREKAISLAADGTKELLELSEETAQRLWHIIKTELLPQTQKREIGPVFEDPAIPGYTYQYWALKQRRQAQRGIEQANKRSDTDQVIAFTMIYTPDWVVDFLTVNALAIKGMHPQKQELLVPGLKGDLADQESLTGEPLRIIDPACGAGHFLVRALELAASTRTPGTRGDGGCSSREFKLEGVDIDNHALAAASIALAARAMVLGIEQPSEHLRLTSVAGAPSGSLHDDFAGDHPLSARYDIVLTNPPYTGRKLLSREMKNRLRNRYPGAAHDLSAAFILRSLELLEPEGVLGVITQSSLLSLPSYAAVRRALIDEHELLVAVNAGPGCFPLQGGEKVASALLLARRPQGRKEPAGTRVPKSSLNQIQEREQEKIRPRANGSDNDSDEPGCCLFLDIRRDKGDKSKALRETIRSMQGQEQGQEQFHDKLQVKSQVQKQGDRQTVYPLPPAVIRRNPGYAFTYTLPQALAESLSAEGTRRLEQLCQVKQGLATTDNARFLRYIWQVEKDDLETIWFPYVKGAGSARWYSPVRHAVDWEDNGRRIKESVARRYPYLQGKINWVVKNEGHYFRRGNCFSFVNTRGLAVRQLPGGCIFDVGASALFAEVESCNDLICAYLNSSLIVALTEAINPTINFQVGDLKRLPMLIGDENSETASRLKTLAKECISLSRELAILTDPGSWYDPELTEEMMAVWSPWLRKGGAGEELFHQHLEQRRRELASREEEIDEQTMEASTRNMRWSVAESASVRSWLEHTGERRQQFSQYKHPVQYQLLALCAMAFLSTDRASASRSIAERHIAESQPLSYLASLEAKLPPFLQTCFEGQVPADLQDSLEKFSRARCKR